MGRKISSGRDVYGQYLTNLIENKEEAKSEGNLPVQRICRSWEESVQAIRCLSTIQKICSEAFPATPAENGWLVCLLI